MRAGAQAPLSGKVAQYNGRPTIFVNDKPEYPMLYALTDVPGGRWAWEEVPKYNMKSFCLLGIRLIQVDIAFDHVWRADGTIVTDTVQRQLKAVLDNCPETAVLIRFHVNPPKWWQRKHPEENTVYADREPKPDISWGLQRLIEDDEETPVRTSIASEKWKEETTQKLIEFLDKLKNVPESRALIGIQVAGGVYGEWHYWGFIENEPDMSTPMETYFRKWLTEKYKTDDALRKSWNNSNVSLALAPLPTLKQRLETTGGVFRDPVKERAVIDYYEAQHHVVTDAIIHFCKVVKEHWPRPIITGAFYGYFYAVFGREAAGGHLDLQRVLTDPNIDFLCGPGTYYPSAVEMGDPYRSRSLINSVTLHGKLWLDEMDQQPPLLPLKDKGYAENLDKSIAQVRRNVLFTMTKGQGLWFYDFGPAGFNGGPRLADHGTFGWWDEPTLRENIRLLKELGERRMQATYSSDADVLVVHDTESFYNIASNKSQNSIVHRSNNWVPVGIFKSGAVHDVIHLDDLSNVDLSAYKVIVFVNTYVLSVAERKFINEKVAQSGRHLVWIYAPGYSDGKSLQKSFIEDVTGLQITMVHPEKPVEVVFDPQVAGQDITSSKESVDPLFLTLDPKIVGLGKVEGFKGSGFAKKQLKESTAWFFSLPADQPAVWRYIFREAGAHLYDDDGDVFYAGNGVLVLHSKPGGNRTVRLKNGKEIPLVMPANSTVVVDNATGATVGNGINLPRH